MSIFPIFVDDGERARTAKFFGKAGGMMASRPECPLDCPSQAALDAFRQGGVDIMALATPSAMQIARGYVAHDGLFEPDAGGDEWLAFRDNRADDIVFWRRETGALVSWSGRVFALGQDVIDEATTYSFDCALNVFFDPLDWLRSRRDGIVVLPNAWPKAFDRLRDCPRIALAESMLPLYRRHMQPARLPELFIIPDQRRAA